MTPQELRSRRVAIGVSIGELAFEVRLPMRAVQDIETGTREVPDAETFCRALERMERGCLTHRASSPSGS